MAAAVGYDAAVDIMPLADGLSLVQRSKEAGTPV
jgi:hypothetical protein